MKLDSKTKNNELLEVVLTLPWSEFEPTVGEATKILGRDLEVPGFRKGNAPLEAVQQKLGFNTIYEEAASRALRQNWPDITRKVNQETVGRPKINVLKLVPQNELIVAITFILRPKARLPDYRSIAREVNEQRQKDFDVTEEELKSATAWLLRSRAKYLAVTREAQKGDFVEIDFNSFVDGQALEGGLSHRHPLILGESRFIKGFEDELVGLKAGEHKKFSLKAPTDYYRQDLAGQQIDFEVTILSVQDIELPEFNDDFAKGMGKFQKAEELKQNIIEGLKEEKIVKERKEFETKLIKAIADKSKVQVPEPLIEEELDATVSDLKAEVAKAKVSFEDYLKQIGKGEEELRRSLRARAERNLKVAFLFQAIAKKENLTLESEEVDQALNNYLKKFASTKEVEKQVDLEALKVYTENTLLNQKVLTFLENAALSSK